MAKQAQPQPPWQHLVRKPGSRYRQFFVNGRIAARTLYSYFVPGEDWPGQTVEEIAADCGLPVEAVREAIAYCQADPPAIREDLAMEERRMALNGIVASCSPRKKFGEFI